MESNCNVCKYCKEASKMMIEGAGICFSCAIKLTDTFNREKGGMHWDTGYMGTENSICNICFNSADFFDPTEFPQVSYCSSCKSLSANPISIKFKYLFLTTGMNLRIIQKRSNILDRFDEFSAGIKAQFTDARNAIDTHSYRLIGLIDKTHKNKQEELAKMESEFNRMCTEVFLESSSDEINNKNMNFMKNLSDLGENCISQELASLNEVRKCINTMLTLELEDINKLIPENILFIQRNGIKLVYLEHWVCKSINLDPPEEIFQECSYQLLPSGKLFFCGGAKNLTAHDPEVQGKCFILTPNSLEVKILPECTPRRRAAVIVAKNQVFVFGGMTKSCQRLEINAETWEDIADLPFESEMISGICVGDSVKLVGHGRERMYEYDVVEDTFRENEFRFMRNTHKVLLATEQRVFCLTNGEIMHKSEADKSWISKGNYEGSSASWSNNGWIAHNEYIFFSDGTEGICRLDTSKFVIEKIAFRQA